MHAIDRLIEATIEKQNPTILGLDTRYEYVPNPSNLGKDWLDEAMNDIWQFNKTMIDALCDMIPAVKVQLAYYEMYGVAGMQLYQKTVDYAASQGLFVVADAKRNDIGSTAEAYARAYLGESQIEEHSFRAFAADMLTVNPYFGSDGILPFVEQSKQNETGAFVLVKTSNPSGGEFQDLSVEGKPLYYHVAAKVNDWGKELRGSYQYSSIGAVVGATYPEQSAALREAFPQLYFLVPGYGAQGGTSKTLAPCFDKNGLGAIVNASRSLLCAYQKHPGKSVADATRIEAQAMKEDLLQVLGGTIRGDV